MFVQWKILEEIRETGWSCRHSLFIFDESDKMPNGVLDEVQRYLTHFKHSISIFLR